MSPVISVLCPSRGRPLLLEQSVRSLLSQAEDPGAVEVLVGADPDDPDTCGALLPEQARVTVFPSRLGYKRINEYYNELAARSSGDWLFLWNDDAVMLTGGWDRVIREEPLDAVLQTQASYVPEINTFPVWPAAWTRHLGHVSLDQSADFWLYELARLTGASRSVPVHIRHLRVEDVTAAERNAVADVMTFHTVAMYVARELDSRAIKELMGWQ